MIEVETEGETRAQRLLWAVALGDLVSLFLAAANGVDPEPVEVIERLKERARPRLRSAAVCALREREILGGGVLWDVATREENGRALFRSGGDDCPQCR